MTEIVLKTTLKCGGCVDAIRSDMDKLVGKDNWSVDLQKQPREMHVKSEQNLIPEISAILKEKGFSVLPY